MGALRYFSVLEFVELKTLDGRYSLFPAKEVSPEITLIMIDGKSEVALGALPWDGEYRVMLDTLALANPRAVCLLVLFNWEWEGAEVLPSDNLFVIRPYQIPTNYAGRTIVKVSTKGSLPDSLSRARGQSFSHMPLGKEDGIRRHAQLVVAESYTGDYHHSLELLAICHYFGVGPENISITSDFWHGKYLRVELPEARRFLRFPIDSQGRMLVNFAGAINDFSNISFVDALDLSQADKPGIDIDLDEHRSTFIDLFHDKLVLIGITADGTPRSLTPKGNQTALAMRANVINTLLTQNSIVRLSYKADMLYLAALVIIAAVASVFAYESDKGSSWLLGLKSQPTICLVLLIFHILFTLILFRLFSIWVDVTTPLLALLISGVISSLYIGYLRLQNLISELKFTQQQLVQSEKEAVYGQMAKQVRHEIGNLLGSIRRPAEMVRNNFQKADPLGMREQPEQIIDEMDTIIQRVMRLNDMVENELRFFQNANFNFGLHNLVDIINATLDILEPTIQKYNIEVLVEIDPSLPPILADADMLQIAFMNLIKNACQAMPEGGKLLIEATCYSERSGAGLSSDRRERIETKAKGEPTEKHGEPTSRSPGFACFWFTRLFMDKRNEKNSTVVIKLHDTGVGIRAEDIDRIFEPLYTTKARGFGVGLANAKNIIEGHAGEITVEKSELGVGTTFKMTIPANIL